MEMSIILALVVGLLNTLRIAFKEQNVKFNMITIGLIIGFTSIVVGGFLIYLNKTEYKYKYVRDTKINIVAKKLTYNVNTLTSDTTWNDTSFVKLSRMKKYLFTPGEFYSTEAVAEFTKDSIVFELQEPIPITYEDTSTQITALDYHEDDLYVMCQNENKSEVLILHTDSLDETALTEVITQLDLIESGEKVYYVQTE